MRCQCEGLEVGQYVTVFLCCDRCIKGRIVCIDDDILTLQGKCCRCYYINLRKILYICGECTVTTC